MFALGNLLIGIGGFLDGLLWFYMIILLVRALISWVNADPRNAIVRFLSMVTDPVVERVRRLLPMKARYFPLDLAFLVTFAIAYVLRFALAQNLIDAGVRMRGTAGLP